MNGFMVFTRKEAREILRTWRVWVLPGILLLFALTGPVLARFTPEIVGAVAGNQLGGLKLPTPTYLDAYTQWIKNLSQVAQFALIIIYAEVTCRVTRETPVDQGFHRFLGWAFWLLQGVWDRGAQEFEGSALGGGWYCEQVEAGLVVAGDA